MAEVKFHKHKDKKQPKDIPETKAAVPKKRFDIKDMPNNEPVSSNVEKEVEQPAPHYKKPGRKRTSILTAVVRVNDDNLSRINALKETLSLNSQDEVVTKAVDMFLDSLSGPNKRVYDALLEVQKRKIRARH